MSLEIKNVLYATCRYLILVELKYKISKIFTSHILKSNAKLKISLFIVAVLIYPSWRIVPFLFELLVAILFSIWVALSDWYSFTLGLSFLHHVDSHVVAILGLLLLLERNSSYCGCSVSLRIGWFMYSYSMFLAFLTLMCSLIVFVTTYFHIVLIYHSEFWIAQSILYGAFFILRRLVLAVCHHSLVIYSIDGGVHILVDVHSLSDAQLAVSSEVCISVLFGLLLGMSLVLIWVLCRVGSLSICQTTSIVFCYWCECAVPSCWWSG